MSNTTPQIFIRTFGGQECGLGHVVRSHELARLLRARGLSVLLSVNTDAAVQAILDGSEVPVTWTDRFEEVIRDILSTTADLVVFDQPLSSYPYISRLRRQSPRIVIALLDPPRDDVVGADVIINLFNHSGEPWRRNADCVYREGVRYAILRHEFTEQAHVSKGTSREVLISFGGVDPNRLTLKVLSALRGIDLSEWKFHVIIGAGYGRDVVELIRAVVTDLPAVGCSIRVANMASVMQSCAWGITGAGTTLIEMAFLGKATLTLAQTVEEFRFAQHFGKHGATEFLGLGAAVSEEMIAMSVRRLCANEERRMVMGARAQRIVDGRGVSRVVSLLLQAYKKRREGRSKSA